MAHTHASSKSDLNPSRLFDCSNIVALVTGGATGIGEMAASGLIQSGARVIIASRKESELKSESLLPPTKDALARATNARLGTIPSPFHSHAQQRE